MSKNTIYLNIMLNAWLRTVISVKSNNIWTGFQQIYIYTPLASNIVKIYLCYQPPSPTIARKMAEIWNHTKRNGTNCTMEITGRNESAQRTYVEILSLVKYKCKFRRPTSTTPKRTQQKSQKGTWIKHNIQGPKWGTSPGTGTDTPFLE